MVSKEDVVDSKTIEVVKEKELSEKENIKIGILLKNLRKSKNLSLDEVVKDIRIRKIFLEALEKEDFASLPERTYALGYLKVYLNYLEVADADVYLKKMDDSYNFMDPDYQNTEYASPLEEKYTFMNVLKNNLKNNKNNKLLTNKKIIFLGLLTISIITVFSITFLDLTKKDDGVKRVAKLKNESGTFIANEYVTEEKTYENKPEQESNNSEIAGNSNIPEASIPATKTADVDKNVALVPEDKEVKVFHTVKFPTETRDRTIKINFLDTVWVRIYDSKNPDIIYMDKIFNKGDEYEIPGVEGLMMSVADYAKVDVTVSGTHIVLFNNKRKSHVVNNIILEDKYLLNKYSIAD